MRLYVSVLGPGSSRLAAMSRLGQLLGGRNGETLTRPLRHRATASAEMAVAFFAFLPVGFGAPGDLESSCEAPGATTTGHRR